ncbi:MAG: hypothetical protein IT239_04335 [Bacteroidia bacterium]|nr:hypothetical protein [Bacteroidia bacterium]
MIQLILISILLIGMLFIVIINLNLKKEQEFMKVKLTKNSDELNQIMTLLTQITETQNNDSVNNKNIETCMEFNEVDESIKSKYSIDNLSEQLFIEGKNILNEILEEELVKIKGQTKSYIMKIPSSLQNLISNQGIANSKNFLSSSALLKFGSITLTINPATIIGIAAIVIIKKNLTDIKSQIKDLKKDISEIKNLLNNKTIAQIEGNLIMLEQYLEWLNPSISDGQIVVLSIKLEDIKQELFQTLEFLTLEIIEKRKKIESLTKNFGEHKEDYNKVLNDIVVSFKNTNKCCYSISILLEMQASLPYPKAYLEKIFTDSIGQMERLFEETSGAFELFANKLDDAKVGGIFKWFIGKSSHEKEEFEKIGIEFKNKVERLNEEFCKQIEQLTTVLDKKYATSFNDAEFVVEIVDQKISKLIPIK